jgi:hypothetical protein
LCLDPAHRQTRYLVLQGQTSATDLTGQRHYNQVLKRREGDNLRTSYRALHENPQLRAYGHHWLCDKDRAAQATQAQLTPYPVVKGALQTSFEPYIDAFQAGLKDYDTMYTQVSHGTCEHHVHTGIHSTCEHHVHTGIP